MDKNHDDTGRTDGGQFEARNRHEVEPAQEQLPAIGLIAQDDIVVLENILEAQDLEIETYIITTQDSDSVVGRIARELGAKVFQTPIAESNDENLRQLLSTYAKVEGATGIIIPEDGAGRIDIERSISSHQGEEFVSKAVPKKTGSEAPSTSNQTVSGAEQGVLAIIPAYNEEKKIAEVVEQTQQYVDEVLVIDDASTDETVSAADKVADGVISHPENMGVGGAVHTGYQASIKYDYDIVIQIDADGQHDPAYIPDLLRKMDSEDADMVIGSRWLNSSYEDYSFVRRVGIKFFTAETNILGGLDITDVTSGFRAYRVDMLDDLGRTENSHWALEQTLEAARKGYNITEISVPMPPAPDGSQFDLETFLSYPPRMFLTSLKVILFR